jgi:hypothetical protein
MLKTTFSPSHLVASVDGKTASTQSSNSSGEICAALRHRSVRPVPSRFPARTLYSHLAPAWLIVFLVSYVRLVLSTPSRGTNLEQAWNTIGTNVDFPCKLGTETPFTRDLQQFWLGTKPNNKTAGKIPAQQRKETNMHSTTPVLQELTPEQRQRCRELLEENTFQKAREILAQPEPAGIGINFSVGTFSRLKQQLELEDFFHQRQDTRSQTDALAQGEKAAHVQDVAVEMLRQKAFQLAFSKDPDDHQRACRMLRELALVERDSAHRKNYDMATLRLQIAKRVVHALDDFVTLRTRPGMTMERLMATIADRLFGASA